MCQNCGCLAKCIEDLKVSDIAWATWKPTQDGRRARQIVELVCPKSGNVCLFEVDYYHDGCPVDAEPIE
jgi:hypothetical protein